MTKSAKLFERGDDQVLAYVTSDKDGPCIQVVFWHEGIEVAPKIGFKDTDEGWDLRDEAFEKITEESTFTMRAKLLADVGM
jgi:hypothetical protein